MTPGTVIDLFDDFRHQAVIPPQALGIRESQKIFPVFCICIGAVQQIFQNLGANFPAFAFVRHPEVRGHIQSVGIFPQQIAAEAVDGGNLRQEQSLHLLLQVAVVRLLGNALCEFCGNFSPQFRCGGLGICNDQKFVQIGRIGWVGQVSQQPIHQHLGFSGTGSS